MRVVYNNINLGLVNVHMYEIEPVMDQTGRDLRFHRIHARFSTTLNPFATATNKVVVGGDVFGGQGVEGDRLGITIANLKDALETPRKGLQIFFGPDQIVDCPGAGFSCDPDGGPYPEPMQVHQIAGDKTAGLVWGVRFCVLPCQRYLLSNRWSVRATTANEGMSTRRLVGTAYFRKDYLTLKSLTADSFRKWLIAPCPPSMRRREVHVTVSEDDTKLDYEVLDADVGYGMGNWGGYRIEGNVTVGSDCPVKNAKDLLSAAADIGKAVVVTSAGAMAMGPLGLLAGAGAGMAAAWSKVVPIPKANALVRCFGYRGVDKTTLLNAAVGVIYDRLRPLAIGGPDGVLPCVSCYVTQDVGSDNAPMVEARMEFLAVNLNAMKAMLSPALAPLMMSFSSSYSLPGAAPATPFVMSVATPTPQFANSNNTRGDWIGALATAALKANTCTLPAVPADFGTVAEATALA